MEPQILMEAPATKNFIRYLENYRPFFTSTFYMDRCRFYPKRIKIVTIYKSFFSNHDVFSLKFLQVFHKQKRAGARAAIHYFVSGSERQFYFGSRL
jgi:hypothetical protein